jgi:hypothetical protein
MLSEPAVMPRTSDSVLESTCAVCPVSAPSAIPASTPDRSYLRLVSNDVVPPSAPETTPVVATLAVARARPTSDDIASPPLAAPLEAVASALWASPAEVLGLLAAASEHRRVVDLIWNAAQIGALQLPPPLLAAMERARASWPQALPISC